MKLTSGISDSSIQVYPIQKIKQKPKLWGEPWSKLWSKPFGKLEVSEGVRKTVSQSKAE